MPKLLYITLEQDHGHPFSGFFTEDDMDVILAATKGQKVNLSDDRTGMLFDGWMEIVAHLGPDSRFEEKTDRWTLDHKILCQRLLDKKIRQDQEAEADEGEGE